MQLPESPKFYWQHIRRRQYQAERRYRNQICKINLPPVVSYDELIPYCTVAVFRSEEDTYKDCRSDFDGYNEYTHQSVDLCSAI